jgi:hypothetical protein
VSRSKRLCGGSLTRAPIEPPYGCPLAPLIDLPQALVLLLLVSSVLSHHVLPWTSSTFMPRNSDPQSFSCFPISSSALRDEHHMVFALPHSYGLGFPSVVSQFEIAGTSGQSRDVTVCGHGQTPARFYPTRQTGI